ncbi:hypothetical protein MSAN_01253100 [Mycena sanguinolenta]|uniref:DUF6699 domain-containing protein n=1 Tax=Mycena sanguinolenta TaxID=230812 RepID=A0A8H6YI35_9AGAR|nr:hypothetical protein MSAN_01253100 [Mycena sanguinolenta]
MAEPAITPFIPPLAMSTPGPSPNPAPQPPVLPQVPTGANPQYPAWASQPQGAGNYPIYPNTPYTGGGATPFIPYQPLQQQPGMPYQYFPGTGPPPASMQLPPETGAAAGGYTPFGPAPAWPGMYPGTPYAPQGGMPGGMPPGTPWSQGAPSPYVPAGYQMGAFGPQPPPQVRPLAWGGGGGGGGQFTPGDAWAGQGHAVPPWAQAQMAQMAGGMPPGMPGMGMHGGMPGGMPGMGMHGMMPGMGAGLGAGLGLGFGMMEQQQPLSRAIGQVGDRVGDFEAGPNYGPVLEPFLIRAVHAHVRLNPLIQPLSDATAADPPPYLKWNMLFPSNQCQRSDESVHMSWSNGRQQPATFPRVSLIQLVSDAFPFVIKIPARNRDIGVTCGELIDYISRDMHQLTAQAEYEALPSNKRRVIGEAYRHNRSRANGVPGGQLHQGMLRLDWLGQDTMFGGIRDNERLVRLVCGDVLPCTFELVCMRRYPMTAEELRNQEIMQRNLSEREARRRSRRSTVESITDEDDGDNNEEADSSDDEASSRGRRGRRS